MSDPKLSVIKKLAEEDFDDFIRVSANAYPGIKLFSPEAQQKLKQRMKEFEEDLAIGHYGAYRAGQYVGGMRLFDYTMKILSVRAPVGGVGMVGVDLLHKKEKVARDLIVAFLEHYRERGATMAILYPFRPDFYKQMGFGYGTKINQYRVKPQSLPRGGSKEGVFFLQKGDEPLLVACYDRYLERTNGLIEKKQYELKGIFENPEVRILAVRKPGEKDAIAGYLVFGFKSVSENNGMLNNIVVRELIYDSSEALLAMLKFLQGQADQINEIVFNTQDEYFHYLLGDPRNGTNNMIPPVFHESNLQGVGIMYRVIDTPGIFKLLADHNFGAQTCKLKLTVNDSFFKPNNGSLIIHFEEGRPRLAQAQAEYEVEVELDVSDFSSLLMGAVDFKALHTYGLAKISETSFVEKLNTLFRTTEKPLCTTPF